MKKITKEIRQKIVKKDDLFRLLNLAFNEYQQSKGSKYFYITLTCENDEIYEFKDRNLNANEQLLDLKRILHIQIGSVVIEKQRIEISLAQGNNEWKNKYSIEGNEEEWVDATNKKIDDFLAAMQPQKLQVSRYRWVLFFVLAVNLGFALLRILAILLNQFDYKSSEPDLSSPLIFLMERALESFPQLEYVAWTIGAGLLGAWLLLLSWDKIEKNLDDIWPSVEFDFGPEHKKYSKNKRKALAVVGSLIVLPLILQIMLSSI